MKILILGASGFVGSHVTHLLLEKGFSVYCAGRNREALERQFPEANVIVCDFLKDSDQSIWLPRLKGIDIIINCVGVFYDPDRTKIWKIHFDTPQAIYKAAVECEVKQIIHLSALGIETYSNDYASSKLAAEKCLNLLPIPHVILRPSFIYGAGAKGGINLMKKLAAFPVITPLPGGGEQKFQPIHVEDLAAAISHLLNVSPSELSLTLAAVSTQPLTFKEILLDLKQSLGLKKGVFMKVPLGLIKLFARGGDFISSSTINSQSINMLEKGNYTSEQEAITFQQRTGVVPRAFKTGLSTVAEAERWHPRLSLIRPALLVSLAVMWLVSAISSVLPSTKVASYELLTTIGVSSVMAPVMLYGAAVLNALIGIALLFKYKVKFTCLVQILVILIYTLIISIYLPYLWLEPFGPIIKNLPILVSICILYILES